MPPLGPIWTWWRWRRSPTWFRWWVRTARLCGKGLRRSGGRSDREYVLCWRFRNATRSGLDESDLGFRLAPRINAAGRLYRADAGVELLLTDDPERAGAIAVELSRANSERRATEREVDAAAEAARRELPEEMREARGLVAGRRGLAPRRGRDRRLAAGRAPLPAGGRHLAGRGRKRARFRAQHLRLRPARCARGVRRAPRGLRRAPGGGGAADQGRERRGVPARRSPPTPTRC